MESKSAAAAPAGCAPPWSVAFRYPGKPCPTSVSLSPPSSSALLLPPVDRSTIGPLSSWPSRLLIIAAVFFFVGWGPVFVSGYGGNSTGGSELVWRVGGLMVYASVPTLLMAGLLQLLPALRSVGRRSRSD